MLGGLWDIYTCWDGCGLSLRRLALRRHPMLHLFALLRAAPRAPGGNYRGHRASVGFSAPRSPDLLPPPTAEQPKRQTTRGDQAPAPEIPNTGGEERMGRLPCGKLDPSFIPRMILSDVLHCPTRVVPHKTPLRRFLQSERAREDQRTTRFCVRHQITSTTARWLGSLVAWQAEPQA